jgi:hypothetical protein
MPSVPSVCVMTAVPRSFVKCSGTRTTSPTKRIMWLLIGEMKDKFDRFISDFTYVRWLGGPERDRKTTTWDKVIVDCQGDLFESVCLLKKVQERRIMIPDFANMGDHFWPGGTPRGATYSEACRRYVPINSRRSNAAEGFFSITIQTVHRF